MKIYLASFFEVENFGKGRLISVAKGKKPRILEINLIYNSLAPNEDISRKYYIDKQENDPEAGDRFTEAYSKQLNEFLDQAKQDSKEQGKSVMNLLDLQEEDNLLSWERAGRPNYRRTLAIWLKTIGYDVVLDGEEFKL